MREIDKSADIRHEEHKYDDIIMLPHHVSVNRPHMSLHDRAAQFSPFAALTGYGDAVKETARLTDSRVELDENSKAFLDERLRLLQEQINNHPRITVTYFQPDQKKTGGAYVEAAGDIKKIEIYERVIVLCDGKRIPIDEVIRIEGDVFRSMQDACE